MATINYLQNFIIFKVVNVLKVLATNFSSIKDKLDDLNKYKSYLFLKK